MFTGLIETKGKINNIEQIDNGKRVIVFCPSIAQECKLGDSIAIDGVCLTVTEQTKETFSMDLSEETLRLSLFLDKKVDDLVNLEQALKVGDRLGGHIVQGHIDGIARLVAKKPLTEFYELSFEVQEQKHLKYIVKKGSITLNGISLTVASIKQSIFSVAIIPHTYNATNLKELITGDQVHLEVDIIGKYVESLLGGVATPVASKS